VLHRESLDQVQSGVIGRKRHRTLADPQLFEPRLPLRTLGYAHQQEVGQTDLCERFPRRVDLSFAAVDENQVGRDPLPACDPAVAARKRLSQGAVVVARTKPSML